MGENKMDKLKNYFKRGKRSWLEIATYMSFLIVVVINLGISFSNPNSGFLPNQTIDGLSFENAQIDIQNGISKYTVEVINNLKENVDLQTIEVVLKNENGDELTSLIGYVGENLESGEKKILEASIDEEVNSIHQVEYHIHK